MRLLKNRLKKFSYTVYSNKPTIGKENIGNMEYKYDTNLHDYPKVIKAYLEKRRINKDEIWPKVYILDKIEKSNMNEEIQELFSLKNLYNDEELNTMQKRGNIDTGYFMSIFLENYFKEFLDEYLKKIPICGNTVSLKNAQKQENLEKKIKKLYRLFFWPENETELDKYIEELYLDEKINKLNNSDRKIGLKNVIFSKKNFKRINLFSNCQNRDLEYFDDYLPIFDSSNLKKKSEALKNLSDSFKNELNLQQKLLNFFTSFKFQQKQKENFFLKQNVQTHFFRLEEYIKSIEFNHTLNIPPDFFIEFACINFHIWLLLNRLNDFKNQKQANTLKTQILSDFQIYIQKKVFTTNVKNINSMFNNITTYLETNRKLFNHHFNYNETTFNDVYYKIDCLAWSGIFFKKIERYDERVYLMSGYMIENYFYVKNLGFEEILNCEVDFSVFSMPVDYKKIILEKNPVLSREEFSVEEGKGEDYSKKFDYDYEEEFDKIENRIKSEKSVFNQRLRKLFSDVDYVKTKFHTLENYDYFNEREDIVKEKKRKSEKYSWNEDIISNFDKDLNCFERDYLKNVKNKIKNLN